MTAVQTPPPFKKVFNHFEMDQFMAVQEREIDPKRGRFLVFEGTDGCGKTTQIEYVENALLLAGQEYLSIKQPGGTTLGNAIRDILFTTVKTENICADAQELLFMASYEQNLIKVKAALDADIWVIADRWSPSALAYMQVRPSSARVKRWHNEILTYDWDRLFLFTGNVSTLLARANARTSETHQSGKTWNVVDIQQPVADRLYNDFGMLPSTVCVPADQEGPVEVFKHHIAPVLRGLGVSFDADAAVNVNRVQESKEVN